MASKPRTVTLDKHDTPPNYQVHIIPANFHSYRGRGLHQIRDFQLMETNSQSASLKAKKVIHEDHMEIKGPRMTIQIRPISAGGVREIIQVIPHLTTTPPATENDQSPDPEIRESQTLENSKNGETASEEVNQPPSDDEDVPQPVIVRNLSNPASKDRKDDTNNDTEH